MPATVNTLSASRSCAEAQNLRVVAEVVGVQAGRPSFEDVLGVALRVVLAEDLYLLRDGITHILQSRGCEIVAAAESGPELREALSEHRPDIAVIDVRLPPSYGDEGLRVALAARREQPGLPVLLVSQHVDRLYAAELLSDGGKAAGYLLKDRIIDGDQFMEAIRCVASGGTVMDPDVVGRLMVNNAAEPLAALTPRERQVLVLMAEGRSNAAIAGSLFLSDGSVSKYTTSIFGKLGIAGSDDHNRRVMAVLRYLSSAETT